MTSVLPPNLWLKFSTGLLTIYRVSFTSRQCGLSEIQAVYDKTLYYSHT